MEEMRSIPDPSSPSASDPWFDGGNPPATPVEKSAEVVPAQSVSVTSPASTPSAAFSRLFAVFTALVLLWILGPQLAERIQYGLSRGRQRAESEVAAVHLANLGLESLSQQYQLVSKRVGPSVVHIHVVADAPATPIGELTYRHREANGQGSGVVVDSAGYILTNHHVVQGAKDIHVSLSEGRRLKAEIVGRDPATDLAVLRVPADNLMAAEWGDSDRLEVGALVWAVGSPFGLQRSVTCGILSAKNRAGVAGRVYQELLQTDAAVNPGNSGGPLVDAQGRVVGINTAIMGDAFQGISFAIPSSVARRVYERLREKGSVERGWLGVGLDDVTEEEVSRLQLKSTEGARIVAVYADGTSPSPAQRAGLQADDVVIRWNGVPIHDAATLSLRVAQTEIGSTAEALVIRKGREITVPLFVGSRPENID